jgi:hypothetical protein
VWRRRVVIGSKTRVGVGASRREGDFFDVVSVR